MHHCDICKELLSLVCSLSILHFPDAGKQVARRLSFLYTSGNQRCERFYYYGTVTCNNLEQTKCFSADLCLAVIIFHFVRLFLSKRASSAPVFFLSDLILCVASEVVCILFISRKVCAAEITKRKYLLVCPHVLFLRCLSTFAFGSLNSTMATPFPAHVPSILYLNAINPLSLSTKPHTHNFR